MKSSLWVFCLAALLAAGNLLGAEAEIAVGDRKFEVFQALGQPQGYIGSDDFQIYYFERGEVVFRDGVVQSHSIVSEEEAARKRATEAHERQAIEEQEKEARENRISEGLTIRDQKVSDPHFNSLSASARLAFWEVFHQKYPEVDIDLQYSVAYQQAQVERTERMAEAERDQRLRELELRVMAAEREAELAMERERRASYYYDDYYYRSRNPVVIIHPHHDKKHRRDDSKVIREETEIHSPPPSEDIRERLNADSFVLPPLRSKLGGESFMFPPLKRSGD